jgi:diaminohydroxyphosphoribosylaminopyrimidine deaminase/5-amino-6-(5-phosphoribosylamino)uracil reductase
MMETDEYYMNLAIVEARKGTGRTAPNPCVGAVIVKDGNVVARGYHKKAGTPHAEINAINSCASELVGASMYVTLEPCSHTGKTPPCCRAIVEKGFAKVVVGMGDPNPLVNGRGLAYLKDHGLEVVCGVLEQECLEFNSPFIKYITTGRPWVIMKSGISLDGRLTYQKGNSGWITGEAAGLEVHRLRDSIDAIMVGANTVQIDNPSLTTRLDKKSARDPVRVILDSELGLSLSLKVFNLESSAHTYVVCSSSAAEKNKELFLRKGVRLLQVERGCDGLDLKEMMYKLAEIGICSVLVEGGAQLHGALLKNGLYDYAHLFYAPLFAGDSGVPLLTGLDVENRDHAPRIETPSFTKFGDDMMISGRIVYK